MATPSLLFMEYRSTLASQPCRVWLYDGTTTTQVGDSFDTAIRHSTGETFWQGANRVIQFKGEIYAVGHTGVWQKDDPTTISGGSAPGWTRVFTFTGPDVANNQMSSSGIYPIFKNGIPHLVGYYKINASNQIFRGYEYNSETGIWSEPYGDFDANQNTTVVGLQYWYENNLYSFGQISSQPNHSRYNPLTQTVAVSGTIDPWGSLQRSAGFFTLNDRLYAMYVNNDNEVTIAYLTSGFEWAPTGIVLGSTDVSNRNNWWGGIEIDGATYIFFTAGLISSADGWRCFRIEEGTTEFLNVTDLSTTVLPSELLATGSGGTFAGNHLLEAMVIIPNFEDDPENPEFYLYRKEDGRANGAGDAWIVYQWEGPDTALSSIGSVGDVFHGPPTQMAVGGERIFSAHALDGSIERFRYGTGLIELDFTAYGDVGTSDKIARLYYRLGKTNTTWVQASLTTPTSGGTLSTDSTGDIFIDIDADDGITEYTVSWDYEADGFDADTAASVGLFLRITDI